MKDWVKMYIEEIDRIENFFLKRFHEYKIEYESLNTIYM